MNKCFLTLKGCDFLVQYSMKIGKKYDGYSWDRINIFSECVTLLGKCFFDGKKLSSDFTKLDGLKNNVLRNLKMWLLLRKDYMFFVFYEVLSQSVLILAVLDAFINNPSRKKS